MNIKLLILLLISTTCFAAETIIRPYGSLSRIGGFSDSVFVTQSEHQETDQAKKLRESAERAAVRTITHDQWLKQKRAFDEAQRTNKIAVSTNSTNVSTNRVRVDLVGK